MARSHRPSRVARFLAVLALLGVLLPGGSANATSPAGREAVLQSVGEAPLPAGNAARRLSAEVYGYLPYWEIDSGTDAYLRYDLLTDIALFSVGFTSTGAINTSATGYGRVTGSLASTIVTHAHAAGVRVDLTVTSFGFAKNAAFFSNPTAMANAASNVAALVTSEGLDGVSLDVELLENVHFAAYGTFVGQLRTALRATNPSARVSVATNGGLSGTGMANQALKNGADRVFLMGYSYRTGGTSPAGSIAPIARSDGGKSLTWTLDLYAAKGVPADQLLLGLPYYGRSWHTTSGALHASTTGSAGVFIPGSELDDIPAGVPIQHDAQEMAKWFAVQDPVTKAWTQTYFDDPQTLRAKYALAAARGLAGVGIWTLGYDRGVAGYWNAISAAFGVTRLSGADRYGTAVAVSREAFSPGVETVYVASGLGFPDALAGAAVAGGSGSPLLLVRPTAIPTVVATELARLKPKRIVALGGPASISDGLLNSLAAYALEGVTRLGGADRFETAVAISQAAFPDGAAVVYVVSGLGFADALAAAPAAARDDAPVLLVAPDDLPDATRDELSRLAPARIVVVGGTAAVNGAVVNSMKALLPASDLVRIAGADRYATAAAVAATFDHGLPVIYLASGLGFADALAAAAAAGARGVPVLLTRTAALPTEAAVAIHGLAPVSAIVVGSTAVVGPPVIWSVRNALAVAT